MLTGRYRLAGNLRMEMDSGTGRLQRRGPAGMGRGALCLGVAAAIVLVGVAVTSRSTRAVQSGYRIVALKAQLATLLGENESLEVEVARLQSLSRIGETARTRLGMCPPDEIRIAKSDDEWKAAMAIRAEQFAALTAMDAEPSLLAFFTRMASGARTAQAKPAR